VEGDDLKRGSCGVVCSLREIGNGRLRLILDDVKNESGAMEGPWQHHVLFTWKDYDVDQIVDLKLSEDELAEFGFHILARLVALREHPIE
jgi:hypothetical protein